MSKLPDLPEIDALTDNDFFYVWDFSDPAAPDKKVPRSKVRPAGVIISNHFRYAANIAIPAIGAATEGTTTISVPGALVGDHVLFNMQDALPADLAVTMFRVSASDTVQVRFRNLHTSVAFVGASLGCTALVTRSVTP
jgi:hypothetical protein